jgi:NTP pyrophosphatase (non-canonical NTP hydrolase)
MIWFGECVAAVCARVVMSGVTNRAISSQFLVTTMPTDIKSLQAELRGFAAERDWDQFHSPKNLAAALAVEASEILEHFQWLTEEQSRSLTTAKRDEVGDELADVLLYLVRLSDKLGVDLMTAANRKLQKNAAKYPVDKSRGNSTKYTEL